MKSYNVIIQMKSTEQYFSVVLFITVLGSLVSLSMKSDNVTV